MKKHNLGSGQIEELYYLQMNALAGFLDEHFNEDVKPPAVRTTGFVLMVFSFGDVKGGRMNYISNADRKDIITALREQLSYFEGMPDDLKGGRA